MKATCSTAPLPRTDLLAIERTLLANERTFLAYFRTSIAFLTSGLAVLHIDFFATIREVSYLLIALSPLTLMAGAWRAKVVHRRILSHYEE
jgi:putative membrane protein